MCKAHQTPITNLEPSHIRQHKTTAAISSSTPGEAIDPNGLGDHLRVHLKSIPIQTSFCSSSCDINYSIVCSRVCLFMRKLHWQKCPYSHVLTIFWKLLVQLKHTVCFFSKQSSLLEQRSACTTKGDVLSNSEKSTTWPCPHWTRQFNEPQLVSNKAVRIWN